MVRQIATMTSLPLPKKGELSDSSSSSSYVDKRRSFLLSWIKIYPWVKIEGTGDNVTVTCKECQKVGLKNDYAKGMKSPGQGWKREYLQHHADHTRHATSVVKTAN